MAIQDFENDLRQLGGTRSKAASVCLARYFHLLYSSRRKLRAHFDEQELREIGEAVKTWKVPDRLDIALRFIAEQLPGEVSDSCGEKLDGLNLVEQITLLDAIQRTKHVKKDLRRDLAGPHLVL